ncbi:hypothetical protein BJV77DRAFT_1003575, partial [Russula vinacea]
MCLPSKFPLCQCVLLCLSPRRSALKSGHPLTLPPSLLSSHPDPVLPTVALPLIDSGPASILLSRPDKCWSHRTSCRLIVVDGQLEFFGNGVVQIKFALRAKTNTTHTFPITVAS